MANGLLNEKKLKKYLTKVLTNCPKCAIIQLFKGNGTPKGKELRIMPTKDVFAEIFKRFLSKSFAYFRYVV